MKIFKIRLRSQESLLVLRNSKGMAKIILVLCLVFCINVNVWAKKTSCARIELRLDNHCALAKRSHSSMKKSIITLAGAYKECRGLKMKSKKCQKTKKRIFKNMKKDYQKAKRECQKFKRIFKKCSR